MVAPSLLICYGREYYKLHEVIEEIQELGVSKRIPLTSIPKDMERGVSKIFCAHPDAIIRMPAGNVLALATELREAGLITAQQLVDVIEDSAWDDETHAQVPVTMLPMSIALSMASNRAELIEVYSIEFCMGIFGYVPFSGFQYVTKEGEDQLPEQLDYLKGYVEPVKIIYEEDVNE